MSALTYPRTPWILWPFIFILRIIAAILGLVIMIVGAILTVLILTAPIGIPMLVFGFSLMLRGFF